METITCKHCGYTWTPRKPQPKKCPSCIKWLIPHPKLFLIALALSIFGSACQNCHTVAPTGNLAIYAIMGQSNAIGVDNGSLPDTADANIKMFKNGQWQTAQEPTSEKPYASYGFGVSFGQAMRKINPSRQIGLVNCAVGSTDLSEQLPDAISNPNLPERTVYQDCQTKIQQALRDQPGSTLAGILYMQGESDVNECFGSWGGFFGSLVYAWHQTYGNIPVVYGQVGQLPEPPCPHPASYIDEFRRNQSSASQANVQIVTTTDLPVIPAGVHFTAQAEQQLGQRMAAQMNGMSQDTRVCSEPWWSRIVRS